MCFIQTSIHFIIVVVLGCIIVGADVVKSNPVNSDSTVSVVSSSSSSSSSIANRTTKRALLFEQSLTTNVPLVLQSSSSPSPSSSSSSSSTKRDLVIEQSFTQTLHILNQSEFNNEELTRYELLMSSYTDNFGYNVSIPYILPSCRVTSQSLASFFGTEESQQVHVLTVAFTMGYYDSQNYDDYDVENYPILFQRYINSHLGVVTKDMRDRWILPVIVAQTVEVVVDDSLTVDTAAPTNSPVVAQVILKEDTDDATFSVVVPVAAGTPTNAPSIRVYSSSSNPFLDTTTSSPSSKPTSTSSNHSTITPSMPSPQHSTTYQLEPDNSLASTSSSPMPYSLPPKLTYHVQSTMVLDSVSHKMIDSNGELDPIAKDGWIQVTQDWIRDATMQYVGSDVGDHDEGSSDDNDDVDVVVIISLDQYKILDDDNDATTRNRSRKSSRRMRSVSSPLQQFYMRGRGLVSQAVPPAAPLQLEFTSVLSFHSSEENWNANEIVASGFRSVEQQTKYIDALKNQLSWNPNDSSFDSMAMEVNGELITDKAIAPTSTTDSMVVWNAAAAAAEEAESETFNGSSIIFGLKNIYLYAIIIAAVCILLLLAVFIHRKRVRRVGSKKVSNTYEIEGENDAALPINEARQKGSRSDDSLVIEMPPDTSGLSGFFGRSLLGNPEDRITVVAPSGKLGLVVSSSPNTDTMPMIVQIKNKSVLAGKAKVGDLLLSVDEVDCRGMTALEVSNLIASRCQNTERVFVLSRELK